ncbi:MAG: hypothetical protein E7297_02165 [Lachnospiraceae bacterium]|jgi:hypothetical protein|nr:hypothetical protein [Lachnospiraceae bacterium]
MNKVELVFDKKLTNLAGYDYGVSIYNEQVKGKIDLNETFEIVFPAQIKGIASSFVQGFFEEIVVNIGLIETGKRARIISENEGFQEMVLAKLQ